MSDEELLNRIPKEHYTLHKNTLLKVEDLLKKVSENKKLRKKTKKKYENKK